jgi:6-phosphofructokinase 2
MTPAPTYLVASGSLPPGVPDDFYAKVARVGHDLGARVVIDTSGAALQAAAAAGVYLLKPNLRELGQLVGEPMEDDDRQEAAVRAMVTAGRCDVLVVSLGAGGVLLGWSGRPGPQDRTGGRDGGQ